MNTLTSSSPELGLLDSLAVAAGAPCDGMRALLRDTALLVTTLATGGAATHPDELRDRCRQLIEHFLQAMERRGYPEDVRREALVAQCGLLDETALRALPPEWRAGWELKPLQVERFNLHDAGESVFSRLEARMREPSPRVELLECYSAILGMGFVGRYAREGESERVALIAALNAQLEKLRTSSEPPFIADRAGRLLSGWLYRLSPWAIAALACAAAVFVWAVWAAALDMQLAHLAPAKDIRP